MRDQAGDLLKFLRSPDPVVDDQELHHEQVRQESELDAYNGLDPDTDLDENLPEDAPKFVNQILVDLSLKELM